MPQHFTAHAAGGTAVEEQHVLIAVDTAVCGHVDIRQRKLTVDKEVAQCAAWLAAQRQLMKDVCRTRLQCLYATGWATPQSNLQCISVDGPEKWTPTNLT
jgi:hypothetical protein